MAILPPVCSSIHPFHTWALPASQTGRTTSLVTGISTRPGMLASLGRRPHRLFHARPHISHGYCREGGTACHETITQPLRRDEAGRGR